MILIVISETLLSAAITDKQLTRGRQYVTAHFVSNVSVKHANNLTHFKAKVDASMRQDSYFVTVSLSNLSGAVRDASLPLQGVIIVSMQPCSSFTACCCLIMLVKLHQRVHLFHVNGKKGGKKKAPCSINKASYNERERASNKVISFDPRPMKHRRVSDAAVK